MIRDMLIYEKKGTELGNKQICGVDEAGRGPLAGPVFAAAVLLPYGLSIEGVDDSKKLSPKKREALFDLITAQALSYSIAYASEQEIDQFNILQATFIAMRRAVTGLNLIPDLVLVDGNANPGLGIPTWAIVGGDGRSANIAAASILAKVSRDRYMLDLDSLYPQYGFNQHKGYGTKLHYERIREHGISPVHRLTFLKGITGGLGDGR